MTARPVVVALVGVLLLLAGGVAAQRPGLPTANRPHLQMPAPCRAATPTRRLDLAWDRMLAAEELLAPDAERERWLVQNVASDDPAIQAFAVTALGRLERPALIPALAPALMAAAAAVRREAANALGQAVQGAGPSDRPRVMREIVARLRERLGDEKDPDVRGAICETLGRLAYADLAEAQAVEASIVDATWAPAVPSGAVRQDAPLPARVGAVKGLESLLRQQVKTLKPAAATIDRLRVLATARSPRAPAALDDDLVRVRRLALLAMAPGLLADETTLGAAFGDDQWEVRRIAIRIAGSGLRSTSGLARDARLVLVTRGLADPDAHVRYEALSTFARNQDAPDCGVVRRAIDDLDPHVSLLAIDQASRCGTDAASVGALRRLARAPAAHDRAWHRAAHAIVSLARVAPDEARRALAGFVVHPAWLVRSYAARAAAALKAPTVLRTLATDANDNVRDAAVAGLSEVEQHAADDVYVAQLVRTDGQLLTTAARALRGSRHPKAVSVLLAALATQTHIARDTSRDARLALLERIGELGANDRAASLEPLLADPDPRVAAAAAAILTRWTGVERTPAPPPVSTFVSLHADEVRGLEGATAVVRLESGRRFTLALLTRDAPVTVAGFARLVECGYYNGLTFHRVEPNFVVQGGSPGANEFAGYPWFMRDELGLASNRRGTVGLSTRGRNTGDGQWYINLADNARLDHAYTVFATVVSGMDTVDALLEGDEIAEVRLVRR